jgi:hypothetical protein
MANAESEDLITSQRRKLRVSVGSRWHFMNGFGVRVNALESNFEWIAQRRISLADAAPKIAMNLLQAKSANLGCVQISP